MAPVTLPPSFYNSFWSPDYRTGLDVLFRQLEAGCNENKEIAEFIESQARAHHTLAAALLEPPLGANRASTSSLQHTLLSLRAASTARGEAHRNLAMELQEHVLLPFNGWRSRHEGRIDDAKDDMLGRNGVVASWEKDVSKLSNLRQTYHHKSRAADDSEDDAKFAPSQSPQAPTPLDSYTHSPPPKHAQLRRSGTVADRISEKLRVASTVHKPMRSIDEKELPQSPTQAANAEPKVLSPPALPRLKAVDPVSGTDSPSSPTQEDAFIPPTDPNGQPMMSRELTSPTTPGGDERPKDAPVYILLSGLSLPGRSFKDLLIRFDQYLVTTPAPGATLEELNTRAVLASRQCSTILGVYEKAFSGEELVQWLSKNVEGFGGEWNRCVDAAGELQRMGHISRVGVGRGFEPDDETFYTLRVNPADSGVNVNVAQIQSNIQSSLKNISLPTHLPSQVSSFSSPLSATTHSAAAHIPSWAKGYLPASFGSDEPAHLRLRREAGNANQSYINGVQQTEARRLEMEERIERGLRAWEKWERERLGVISSVLKHYEATLGKLPKRLADLQEGTALAVEAFNPDADLKALIEGSRTGPFRPRPHIYESVENDAPVVNFGIDLRRWSGETAWKSLVHAPDRAKDAIPEVLEALLKAAVELGADVSDDERRKSWIYEVPLMETHDLRNALNSAELTVDDMVTIAKKYNLPIVAGTVKLWLLELNPPVLGWEGWEDAKAVYPSVGADQERDTKSAVTSVLGRLSPSHFFTVHAAIKYWKDLIDNTKSETEDDDVYRTKLSLSVGRTTLRPQYETELTIQDRTPGLFVADLLEHYDGVFPDLLEKKKAQADRVLPMPARKRTALVDQRISRSRLSETDINPQELLQQQQAMQHPAPAPVGTGTPMPVTETPGPVPEPVPVPAAGQHLRENSETAEAPFIPPVTRGGDGDSDDDFEEPFVPPTQETINVVRPTSTHEAQRPSTPGGTAGRASPASPARLAYDDEATGGASGLKRNTSSEASRLRGPRGARGPRPAHQTRGSVSQLAAQFDQK